MIWPYGKEMFINKQIIIYSWEKEKEIKVGTMLDQQSSKSVKGFWTITDKVLLVKKFMEKSRYQYTISKCTNGR